MHPMRRRGGYIDPLMSVFPLAFLAIVFGIPALIRFTAERQEGLGMGWLRILVVAGALLVLQFVALGMALGEAHHDALSGGQRGGLNRAPALQGIKAPAALSASYLIGAWSVSRIERTGTVAVALYVGAAILVLAAGALANAVGRRRSRAADAGGPAA